MHWPGLNIKVNKGPYTGDSRWVLFKIVITFHSILIRQMKCDIFGIVKNASRNVTFLESSKTLYCFWSFQKCCMSVARPDSLHENNFKCENEKPLTGMNKAFLRIYQLPSDFWFIFTMAYAYWSVNLNHTAFGFKVQKHRPAHRFWFWQDEQSKGAWYIKSNTLYQTTRLEKTNWTHLAR